MKSPIINYLRAGYSGIYLVSCEAARIEAKMKTTAQKLNCRLSA